jgi:hypothetical protein
MENRQFLDRSELDLVLFFRSIDKPGSPFSGENRAGREGSLRTGKGNDSGMAPKAVEIAQSGLGMAPARLAAAGKEKLRKSGLKSLE